MYSIGIDIGGTKIAGGLVADDGTVVAEHREPTPSGDAPAIIDVVVRMIEQLRDGSDVVAIGVAAAGFIDATRSHVYYAPNINWRDEPLRDRLRDRLGLEVTVENDANAAGWAEYRFGVGRDAHDMTLLTVGTGVGGAIITGGRLLRGGFGVGAEIGHLRLVPDGLLCGCGARGCLEQYGSGRALLRMANEMADVGGIGSALAEARGDDGAVSADALIALLRSGDPGSMHALRQLGGWLGQACASLTAVLDPQLFVFGGGVSIAGDFLLDPVRETYRSHLPARGYRPEPRFVVAALGNSAGFIGVADLARIEAHRHA